jgi:hypothetical protein
MNISNIILWKYGSGTCDFMVRNGELIWEDNNISKPTDSELNSWELERQAEETATQYQRDRQPLYPAIGDQLDDLYHKGAFSDEMAVKIKAVKDAHPKPE